MVQLMEFSPRVAGWIGSVAAFCTTISFLPQLVRVWRLKSARDISMSMFLLYGFGLLCWLLYGVLLSSWPMIVANSVTLALALGILCLKVRYDRRDEAAECGTGDKMDA